MRHAMVIGATLVALGCGARPREATVHLAPGPGRLVVRRSITREAHACPPTCELRVEREEPLRVAVEWPTTRGRRRWSYEMAVGADAVLTAEWLDRGPARVGGGVLIAAGSTVAVAMWVAAIALDAAADGTLPSHALDDAFSVFLFAAGSVVELAALIGGISLLGLEDRAYVVRRPWRGGSAVTVAPWLAPAWGGGLRVVASF